MTIIYHPQFLNHYQDSYHPESPQRLVAINAKLEEENLLEDVLTPDPASMNDLERVHTKDHIEFIRRVGEGRIDMDTVSHKETFEIALLAAGGAMEAAQKSYLEKKPAMGLLRPPGHHAGPDYAGGFCYFNNLALAAETLLQDVKKVAIVDIDVHHGNGTSDIFCKRSDVLYLSTHQWGIYPGTGPFNYIGEEDGQGFTVNLPFPSRSGDTTYDAAWEEIISPILNQYKPEAMLVSVGGDAHYMDPLASLTWSSLGYVGFADKLIKTARQLCEGRISFYLEGGYHTGALADIIAGIVAKFRNEETPIFFGEIYDLDVLGKETIERVKEIQASYWNL
ncbi:MAG: histone deacetylase [Thermoplasmata archaeon]|nr:MAG: histone deacetylase [Thermoplasmata archaeon]